MTDILELTLSSTLAKLGVRLSTGIPVHAGLRGPATVYVIELEDVLFRFDSAVLLPESYEETDDEAESPQEEKISGLDVLRTVFLRAKEYPAQKILIAGHTDTKGKPKYNVILSEKRACSALYVLLGNRKEWAAIADEKHQNKDIQQILTWIAREYPGIDCDPQGIDGDIGTHTHTAIRNFQTNFEPVFGRKIKIDGVVGPETWGAFFDVYQDKLATMLDVKVDKLADYRSSLHFAYSDRKAVGCGENWPIEAADKDEYRSRINRRVEFLFFDPDEVPPLDCHKEEHVCDKSLCGLYQPGLFKREYLPVHSHRHPRSIPVFKVPDRPGSANYVPLNAVQVYVAYYNGDVLDLAHTTRYIAVDGKLCDPESKKPDPIDCDRDAWIYCSHREDLRGDKATTRFKKDGSGLPLVGPVKIPCGQDVEVQVDIWAQNDWIVVDAVPVDGARPDTILMADWNEKYKIGWVGPLDGKPAWGTYHDQREKMKQEHWNSGDPIALTNFSKDPNKPLWVGTLSELPAPKAKAILVHKKGDFAWHVGSFNELAPTGTNFLRTSHHTYDRKLVARLAALPDEDIPPAMIDALPKPPSRCFLPGDICWQDQGQTNYCGAFSFSGAMNYWLPYTNNPGERNGGWWNGHVDYLAVPHGARTPAMIVDAARENNMYGRDNNAESLADDTNYRRAMKLIALWIMAGVPVVVLVEEEYNAFSLHWKVVVGFESNRVLIVNSGADDEEEIAHRQPGINYETAPVGNDVDAYGQFYNKWKDTGGGIVDAFSSVDGCTFIPIYPKDPAFAADTVQ